MTPEQILDLVNGYAVTLRAAEIPMERMDPRRYFSSLTPHEALMHAHYLCDGIRTYVADPEQWGKANRHFAALQICLSLGNWHTLAELMDHNKPGPDESQAQLL